MPPACSYIYYMYIRVKQAHLCSSTQNVKNRPNYLFLQSRERTFALLLVPREKKFEKSFIL